MSSNYTTNIFQVNPDREMMEYGYMYFFVTSPLHPVFFVITKALISRNCAGSNITYKLMIIINFFQFGQLITHFLTGPMLIFPLLYAKIEPFITVMGCWFNALWIGDFPMMTLLAICRILLFSNIIQLKKIPIFIKIILLMIMSWTLFLFILGSITQNLILTTPGWDYDYEVFGVRFFEMQEIVISFSCLTISYLAYIFMAYLIYAKKNLSSSVQSRKNEIIILLQSTFVTTYITLLILIWHQTLFSDISFVDMSAMRNQAFMNLGLMLHCYVNPILTIVCNKSVREECWLVLGLRKKTNSNKTQSITVSKASSVHPNRNDF